MAILEKRAKLNQMDRMCLLSSSCDIRKTTCRQASICKINRKQKSTHEPTQNVKETRQIVVTEKEGPY